MSSLRKRHNQNAAGDEKMRNFRNDKSLIYFSMPTDEDEINLSRSQVMKETAKEQGDGPATDAKSKYIVVGYKGDFDLRSSYLEMEHLDKIEGREIYGVSFTTVMPTEALNIVDSKLGFKRKFYPQGRFDKTPSRVLTGDETRGTGKYWALTNIKRGEEVSLYFAPSEGTVTWVSGPLDPNFDMPLPTERLTVDDVSAVTQFEINNTPLANIFLMAADDEARIIFPLVHLMPHLIAVLLMIWMFHTAPKQTQVALYSAGTVFEWFNVFVIYLANLLRKGFDVLETWSAVQEANALADKIHGNDTLKERIRFGAFFEFVNLLQEPFALVLSLYVALYMADDVFLNVLLNIVALEFVTEIDEEITAAYCHWRYGERSFISICLLDITYGIDEGIELWHNYSVSSYEKVREDLRKTDEPNDVCWELLTSKTKGLGLLDSTNDGRDIVSSIQLELGVVNWEDMSEDTLASKGGIFLAATHEATWKLEISKDQRSLLFKHFPAIASEFPWVGSLKFEHMHSYGLKHAKHLVDIINSNENVDTASCWFDFKEGDDCAAILRDGLMDNKTLKTLSVNHSGLTSTGAKHLATLLRGNSTISRMWVASNKFGDAGAIILADALSEGKDTNTTLDRMWLAVNNVSKECRKKCFEKTHGRMVFLSEDHPLHVYFESLYDEKADENNMITVETGWRARLKND